MQAKLLYKVSEPDLPPGIADFQVDRACISRCDIFCQADLPETRPVGSVTWTPAAFTGGTSGIALSARISGENLACCTEVAVVQLVTHKIGWFPRTSWEIDDGRVGLLSDAAPYKPYYEAPQALRGKATAAGATLNITDDPGHLFLDSSWTFINVVFCSDGAAKGHRYGAFRWGVDIGARPVITTNAEISLSSIPAPY